MHWQSMLWLLVLIGFLFKERTMLSHLAAFIAGIVVATVGFTGVAQIADQGVSKVQSAVKEVAK